MLPAGVQSGIGNVAAGSAVTNLAVMMAAAWGLAWVKSKL